MICWVQPDLMGTAAEFKVGPDCPALARTALLCGPGRPCFCEPGRPTGPWQLYWVCTEQGRAVRWLAARLQVIEAR
jgi:hypothetical protein